MTDYTDTAPYAGSYAGDRGVKKPLEALFANFLGHAPAWYKHTIIAFLILNPLALLAAGPTVTGWLIVGQFLFTLAMALKCYPLLPGGMLAIEAVILGLATPEAVYEETLHGIPVILLIAFMVTGVHFLRDMLLFALTKIVLGLRSRILLSFLVCACVAVLSAFLDALTILAVLITVATGFHEVYHKVASQRGVHGEAPDSPAAIAHHKELEEFRAFLRGLLMHAAVGTAIGGISTLVGEPENIIIGAAAGWDFPTFFMKNAIVSMPVLAVGLVTCLIIEKFRIFGYGASLPSGIYRILQEQDAERSANATPRQNIMIACQAIVLVALVLALGFHVAEVGLVGLGVIILAAACNGVSDEHRLGKAFEASMPFAALLVVFFVIAAMIHSLHLFTPVIDWVMSIADPYMQLLMVYVSNGLLSLVSDNVFVAAIYIGEVKEAFEAGRMTLQQFEDIAVAVVMGTGIPAMGTPNGQAAFLFLFTAPIAGLIRLSYGAMVWMALPYVFTTSIAAAVAMLWMV